MLLFDILSTCTMSQATDATLVSSIKQYFITIYTEIGTRNVTHAFFWQVVATALIAIPLRPVLLALSNLLTPQQGKYKPPRFITSIVTRLDSLMRAFHTFIDGVHYFWALLMLVISIPYTRMQDSYKVRGVSLPRCQHTKPTYQLFLSVPFIIWLHCE